MRWSALFAVLLLPATCWPQSLPFSVSDPNLQETLEFLAIEINRNKEVISRLDVTTDTAVGQAVNAEAVVRVAEDAQIRAQVSTAVYTTGSYSDPAWITKIATSKVDLSTVASDTAQIRAQISTAVYQAGVATLSSATVNGPVGLVGAASYLTAPSSSTLQWTQIARLGVGTGVITEPLDVNGNAYIHNALTASSGTFTASGVAQYSVATTSGINSGSVVVTPEIRAAVGVINDKDADGVSLDVSSSIALGGCVKFPGGAQCGPAGDGTGDMVQATFNTNNQSVSGKWAFSGASTFTATLMVGPSGLNSAANYSSIIYGIESPVAYTSFTAVVIASFTGLNPAFEHVVRYTITQNASNAYLWLRYNGDHANNYQTMTVGYESGGSGTSYGGNREFCIITAAASANYFVQAGYDQHGHIDCAPANGDTTRMNCTGLETHLDAINYGNISSVGCYYDGAAAVTTWALGTSAGTMTGYATLYARMRPMP